jgi:hypothetical protein
MTKLLSSVGVAIAVAAVSLLAGCQLYFGSSGSSDNGNASGSNGSGTSTGNPPGFSCNNNSQCAAGCFCSASGVCTEGGFCAGNQDCGTGFHCDTSRSSCIPNPQCASNDQCKPGAACDQATGACATTCLCDNDSDAIKQGFGWCDEARGTCMAGSDPAGACLGELSCTTAAPICAEGQVALVKSGCFTGQCRDITACEGAPACSSLQHEDDCKARSTDCTAVFAGQNCTGQTCGTPDPSDCKCETTTFAKCDVMGSPVIIPGN